jgi:hypothetical protein
MNFRRPPALATWLLDRLGLAEQNPPLAGDLLEAFQQGRSRAWYWRQTLMAIAIGCGRNLRTSPRFLVPLCSGFAAQTAVVVALRRSGLPPHGIGWAVAMSLLFAAFVIANALMNVHFIGRASVNLRRLLVRDDLQKRDRVMVSRMVAADTFIHYLILYCILACLRQPSLSELAYMQAIWLLIDLTVYPLVHALRRSLE